MREGGHKPFVDLHRRKPGNAPPSRLRLEAPLLLHRIGELVIAVRELHSVHEELEPFRAFAVRRSRHAGERGLARRIVVEKDSAGSGKP